MGIDAHFSPDGQITYDGREWRRTVGAFLEDGRRYKVRVYSRLGDEGWWQIITVAGARYDRYFDPLFNLIVASIHTDLDAQAIIDEMPAVDLARRVTQVGGFGYLPLVFAPIGLILLFVRIWPDGPLFRWIGKRPTGLPIETAGLHMVTVAATAVFFLPETELLEYWGPLMTRVNPLATLQLVVAGTTVFVVAAAAFIKRFAFLTATIRDLIALNVGVFALFLIYAFYGGLISIGKNHLAGEVSVFLLTVVWDFARSGEQITNTDGRTFRRPARIMVYLGYIALIATMTLFFSAQSVGEDGAPIEKVLEGEEIARQGLIWLGAPVLLLRFLLGWAKAHPAEPEGEFRLRRY